MVPALFHRTTPLSVTLSGSVRAAPNGSIHLFNGRVVFPCNVRHPFLIRSSSRDTWVVSSVAQCECSCSEHQGADVFKCFQIWQEEPQKWNCWVVR